MHPAKSVIFFTTATGAGYGLMFWLGVLALMGELPDDRIFAWASMVIGFGLIVGGLLSSTLHLGHPERAWRAFSQWRSSWLSREGVMAILTFIPLSLFAIYWLFLGQSDGIATVCIVTGGVMSLITVFTTAMIYASLKTIPAWHNIWTKLGYLVLCLMSGGLLLLIISYFADQTTAIIAHLVLFAIFPTGLVVKLLYWRHIGKNNTVSTAESATGLGRFGKVSFAGSPHTADNYLLKEMGFKIARKHASKLRWIASFLGFIAPIALTALGAYFGQGLSCSFTGPCEVTGFSGLSKLLIILAGLSCAVGLIIERWLFFAEAKHVVTLYYGESEV